VCALLSEGEIAESLYRESIAHLAGTRKLPGMAVAERIEVADAPDRERYELSIDGEVVGFTAYRARPGLIAFVHTEVDERLQGQGLADRLIRFALEDARTRGLAVLPFCPFVKGFIERHREFEALVPDSYREQFGL
jgi:predicted GNAT family acetyltransferase